MIFFFIFACFFGIIRRPDTLRTQKTDLIEPPVGEGQDPPGGRLCDFQLFWVNPQGVWFKFAEKWYNSFLHTAGRVMTLPYGCANGNTQEEGHNEARYGH